ncbi:unnamed protein product [Anisakis simplex]|uniref:Arginine/serine-rich coiled-coil protein 2 n=1 Tax=Anisakis simplex TaxID=6269 RepID=A0A0M3J295_ANISI|nr:unnamed protein product [Anisakis simplex]
MARSRSRSRSRDRHRRARSRSRSRNRSRSRDRDSRRRHHGHDRSKRSSRKNTEEKNKDAQKGIELVKSRMRSGLDSALSRQQFSGLPIEGDSMKEAKINDFELSVAEAASRHRDIERIDEGSFRPASFHSTAGGAGGRVKKEDPTDREAVIEKKQDAHDKAMFGPKWRDPITNKNGLENETAAEEYTETNKEIELANPRFSADPAERQARWLKLFRERRAQLLCS